MRGGHQMCLDVETGKIYLFGGWNGNSDLADFWVFTIKTQSWRCISKDTSKHSGPSPRSCHKICYDAKFKRVYLLGKYVDAESRPNVNLENDFWAFDTISERWNRISACTAVLLSFLLCFSFV